MCKLTTTTALEQIAPLNKTDFVKKVAERLTVKVSVRDAMILLQLQRKMWSDYSSQCRLFCKENSFFRLDDHSRRTKILDRLVKIKNKL